MIMSLKRKEIKFKPRIKLNHNIYKHVYRKIQPISPGTYIFQRPFLRGLFLEGPIFGRAYEGNLRYKIGWASL